MSRLRPKHFQTSCGWLWALTFSTLCCWGQWFETLSDAYAAAGFNPRHPGNAVVVFFSDPHMNLWADVLPISTNLDSRLVAIVNSMDPPPRKVIVAGDTSTTLSPVPGWEPREWSMRMGTNEMLHWLQAIRALTNVASEDIVWIPGNHDQLAFEEEAATYRAMYPMMPVRQVLDIAGVRFFLINCGNYGGRNPAQLAWLKEQLAQTPPEKPLVVVNHVPPFHFPPWYRGTALELRELFEDRPGRWWTLGGHYHARSQRVFQIGQSRVASFVVGTSNPRNTNGESDDTGFALLCISNGIHAILYYSYNRARFELVEPPNWDQPLPFYAAFEEVPGLLWRRLKSRGHPPEVERFHGDDSIEWYAYTRELQLTIPLGLYGGQATHLVMLMLLPSADARVEFEVAPNQWARASFARWTNFVYSAPIPEELRSRDSLRVRYSSAIGGNDFISGWGLVTTSAPPWIRYPRFRSVPDQLVSLGETLAVDLQAYVENPHASYDGQRFHLLQAPEGAVLDPGTGMFEWAPAAHHVQRVWEVRIQVADHGTPLFTATQSFHVHVFDRPHLVGGKPVVVVPEGQEVHVAPRVYGAAPFQYRWHFQGLPLQQPETASPTLSFPAVRAEHAGWYHLEVSNAYAGAAGAPFRLGVVRESEPVPFPDSGNQWAFFLGGDPPPAWTNDGRVEEGWETGDAPFGFGLTGVRTDLTHNRTHPACTLYLRRGLVWRQASQAYAKGRIQFIGGAIVYWNGREILRRYVPEGEGGYGVWPQETSEEVQEAEFVIPPELLLPGTNVIAVAVHRLRDETVPLSLWSFDETEAPWRDLVHWHHWYPVGSGIVRVPGRFGGAVSNGMNTGWLEIPPHRHLAGHRAFTVGGWVCYGWGSGDDPESTVLEMPGVFRLYYTGTRVNRYRFRVGTHEVQDQTSGTLPGQWRWVVAWYDGTRAHIQVDMGAVYSEPADLPSQATGSLRALHRQGPSGGIAVDELFYYPRVLTESERARIFARGLETLLPVSSGRAWFDMELALVPLSLGSGSSLSLQIRKAANAQAWELLVPGAPHPCTLWLSTNLVDWIPAWRRPELAPLATWALPLGGNPVPEFYRLELHAP